MTNKEVMQRLITALDNNDHHEQMFALEGIRTALAQPEPEPTAIYEGVEKRWNMDIITLNEPLEVGTYLYKEPQGKWVGLTHEEHMEIMTGAMTTSSRMAAVEAKLKEKNT